MLLSFILCVIFVHVQNATNVWELPILCFVSFLSFTPFVLQRFSSWKMNDSSWKKKTCDDWNSLVMNLDKRYKKKAQKIHDNLDFTSFSCYTQVVSLGMRKKVNNEMYALKRGFKYLNTIMLELSAKRMQTDFYTLTREINCIETKDASNNNWMDETNSATLCKSKITDLPINNLFHWILCTRMHF